MLHFLHLSNKVTKSFKFWMQFFTRYYHVRLLLIRGIKELFHLIHIDEPERQGVIELVEHEQKRLILEVAPSLIHAALRLLNIRKVSLFNLAPLELILRLLQRDAINILRPDKILVATQKEINVTTSLFKLSK